MKKTILALAVAWLVTITYAQDYRAELNELKAGIGDNAGSVKSVLHINQLYYKLYQTDEALKYYDTLKARYQGKEIEAAAVCLSAPILLRKDRFDEVKTMCLSVKERFKGTSWAAECLYNLGEMYLNVYEDKATAETYFRELIKDCPTSGLVRSAKLYLGE
jgi:tetratricopeptide (TPR) repeat protein